ncbi:hypothetical protein ABMA27_000006 [Loxostege sticticalis]|uniref:THAP-type domain-containing protein n=1 Tax=Loxostege sticticalis TaxID=481309 RepID=A0ABR3ILV3_LOXSC
MPSCIVKWCKNNTTSQKKCQGITFHRFPTGNEPWKDDWTRIIRNCRGQEDWSASKSSVVCSIHFDQNDLYTTSKGRRRLVTFASRIKLFMFTNRLNRTLPSYRDKLRKFNLTALETRRKYHDLFRVSFSGRLLSSVVYFEGQTTLLRCSAATRNSERSHISCNYNLLAFATYTLPM